MPLDLETGSIEEAEDIEEFDELIEYVKRNKQYEVPTYAERIDNSNSLDGEDFKYILITPDTTLMRQNVLSEYLTGERKLFS